MVYEVAYVAFGLTELTGEQLELASGGLRAEWMDVAAPAPTEKK